MSDTKKDTVELRFEGGPCDGGLFKLPIVQADVGYKVEWAVRVKAVGATHTYESETVLLEDSDTLTMRYAGKSLDNEEWMPGMYDMTDDMFFDVDGSEEVEL